MKEVSSAVSGTAEQKGNSSVWIKDRRAAEEDSVKLWEDTVVNDWGGAD